MAWHLINLSLESEVLWNHASSQGFALRKQLMPACAYGAVVVGFIFQQVLHPQPKTPIQSVLLCAWGADEIHLPCIKPRLISVLPCKISWRDHHATCAPPLRRHGACGISRSDIVTVRQLLVYCTAAVRVRDSVGQCVQSFNCVPADSFLARPPHQACPVIEQRIDHRCDSCDEA